MARFYQLCLSCSRKYWQKLALAVLECIVDEEWSAGENSSQFSPRCDFRGLFIWSKVMMGYFRGPPPISQIPGFQNILSVRFLENRPIVQLFGFFADLWQIFTQFSLYFHVMWQIGWEYTILDFLTDCFLHYGPKS